MLKQASGHSGIELEHVQHATIVSELAYRAAEMELPQLLQATEDISAAFSQGAGQLLQIRVERAASGQRYVVAESGKAILVGFQGTKHMSDWLANLRVLHSPVWLASNSSKRKAAHHLNRAHHGFVSRSSAVPIHQLHAEAVAQGKQLVLCGHSLGGAVAMLSTLRLLWTLQHDSSSSPSSPSSSRAVSPRQQQEQQWAASFGSAADPNIRCIAFASPAVANEALMQEVHRQGWQQYISNFVLPEDPVVPMVNRFLKAHEPTVHMAAAAAVAAAEAAGAAATAATAAAGAAAAWGWSNLSRAASPAGSLEECSSCSSADSATSSSSRGGLELPFGSLQLPKAPQDLLGFITSAVAGSSAAAATTSSSSSSSPDLSLWEVQQALKPLEVPKYELKELLSAPTQQLSSNNSLGSVESWLLGAARSPLAAAAPAESSSSSSGAACPSHQLASLEAHALARCGSSRGSGTPTSSSSSSSFGGRSLPSSSSSSSLASFSSSSSAEPLLMLSRQQPGSPFGSSRGTNPAAAQAAWLWRASSSAAAAAAQQQQLNMGAHRAFAPGGHLGRQLLRAGLVGVRQVTRNVTRNVIGRHWARRAVAAGAAATTATTFLSSSFFAPLTPLAVTLPAMALLHFMGKLAVKVLLPRNFPVGQQWVLTGDGVFPLTAGRPLSSFSSRPEDLDLAGLGGMFPGHRMIAYRRRMAQLLHPERLHHPHQGASQTGATGSSLLRLPLPLGPQPLGALAESVPLASLPLPAPGSGTSPAA